MSKDGTVKIKEVISISKKEILEKYQDMDKYFRDILEALWESNDSNNGKFLIKRYDSSHGIDSSEDEVGKTGCYMFLCEGVPVYIGVGGHKIYKKKKKKQNQNCKKKNWDLQCRVKQELEKCTNTGATLSKNIKEVDALLEGKEMSADDSVEKIKKFQLITIIVGERNNEDDRYKAKVLETILIALFHPKYNK